VVTSAHAARARRNTAVVGASAVALGLLFLYPTSTNSSSHRRPGTAAAPVGIVVAPRTSAAPRPNPTVVVNGSSADTAYGPVQVQLKVRAGRIVSATAIDYPQGSGTDQQINSYAIPLLQQETVQAQSAHIDTVSGATYTSDGYKQSLQAALDAAHLG
jgi:uncharacterized protein with FMN-binding domain